MGSSFNFFSATAKWIEYILKTVFEFGPRRLLSPRLSLVKSITPSVLWKPKMLFAFGLIHFKSFNLKMLNISEFWMFESNLFHSIMVDRNYEFLKNWYFTLIWGIMCASLVLYWLLDCRITSERYFRHWFLHILKKKHSFLYESLCWRNSQPNFFSWRSSNGTSDTSDSQICIIFRHSVFWWKELLKTWS